MPVSAAAVALGSALVISGCAMTRPPADNERMREHAAAEIQRICALEGEERERALERLRKDTGLALYCAQTR
jgi:hypothetical protein